MIKTPLSTVIGGAFWTPGATVINGAKLSFEIVMKKLFANGEQGFYQDPYDLGVMYQDAAGTAAVNATGQPLGLVLDKSKGLALSANVIPVLDMTTSAWVSSSGGGVASFTANSITTSAVGGRISSSLLQSKKWYKFSLDFVKTGTNEFSIQVQDFVGRVAKSSATSGKLYGIGYTGNAPSLYFRLSAAGSVTISNFVIQELSGNHAYQTTSAARPIFRQKPILGSELVVNGDFSNGTTGWSYSGCTFTVEGGIAKILATGGVPARIQRTITTEIGKTYRLSLFTQKPSGSGVAVGAWIASVSTIYSRSSQGVVQEAVFTATATSYTLNIDMGSSVTAGEVAYIDNVSVKEVLGYRTDQNYIAYDGVDDKLITNLPAQLTGCTVVRSVPNVGTQILTSQTIPATYEDNKDHCGLIVINRALTPSETSAIAAEFNKRAGV